MQNDLQSLRAFYQPLLDATRMDYIREHLALLDTDTRMVGIRGARGVGKSTLLLQYAKLQKLQPKEMLYLSIDHLYFRTNRLLDLVEEFITQGGKLLLLDEVHRYAGWSVEVKILYDARPDLRIIFTGSSILELAKAEGDLSRRAIVFDLPGLSFREFLQWENFLTNPAIQLDEILEYHADLAHELSQDKRRSLLPLFNDYLNYGYYPYYKEGIDLYPTKLMGTVDLLIEQDIPAFFSYTYQTINKIKLLLRILAESPPYKPNISKLAERSAQNRQSVLEQFQVLQKAGLLLLLDTERKGIVRFQKPDKVYLANPNLAYHLNESAPDRRSLREIFFYNQFHNAGHHLNYSDKTDFRLGERYFEIGGKNKSSKQLKSISKGYTAVDNIDVGTSNRIPLWLFGFLY